jgi:peroxiredoxin
MIAPLRRFLAYSYETSQGGKILTAQKYSLPFTLLADPGHRVAEKYGVWVDRNRLLRKWMGIKRSTFVIDAGGNVKRALRGVKPRGTPSWCWRPCRTRRRERRGASGRRPRPPR